MAGPTVGTDFLAVVRRSGLVEEAKLKELFPTDAETPQDPQRAATMLLRAGLVTGFQAKQLLAGKFRGFILGTYRILEPIGKGGMGTVFLAEHASLKRKVALKVLPADKATEHLSLERFQREARSAAALDHPNIVRLHDISQGGGVHFLVMEYVEGNDLQSLMAKTGPLHYVQAAQYVAQAAAGLQHAHDKGFVHRDIKPANLILSRDGNIKILDMGLTRSLNEEADNLTGTLGDTSDVAGTADYISPEQALQQPTDGRSDLYSLGATLFALVTGHPPFRGSTAQKLMQHQLAEPPKLTKLKGVVPPALSEVVAKMLAKKVSERYQSAGEVIDALSPWLPAPTTGNVSQDPVTQSDFTVAGAQSASRLRRPSPTSGRLNPAEHPAGPARWPLVAGGAAVLFAAAGALGAVFFWPSSAPAPAGPARGPEVARAGPAGTTVPPAAPPLRAPAVTRPGSVAYRETFASAKPGKWPMAGLATVAIEGLPAAWSAQTWDKEAAGEFEVRLDAGRPVLAVSTISKTPATQIRFDALAAGMTLTPGARYEVRFEYQLEAECGAFANALSQKDWRRLESVNLSPSSVWARGAMAFAAPPAGEAVQINFAVSGSAPGRPLSLRDFTIWEVAGAAAPAPAPSGALVYRQTFDSGKPGKWPVVVGSPVSDGLPPGWAAENWDKRGEGDFEVVTDEGRPAVSISCLSAFPGTQLRFELPRANVKLTPGQRYEVRVEYRHAAEVGATLAVQSQKGWRYLAQQRLGPTEGWKRASLVFTAPPADEVAQITAGVSGRAPGRPLLLRSLEIIEGATAPEPTAYQLDLGGSTPATAQARNGDYSSKLPGGWVVGAYDPKSVIEGAVADDAGRPVLTMRTVSGPPTGMLFTPAFRLPTGGVTVRGRYKTAAGAAGSVKFKATSPDLPAEELASLPASGEWRGFEATLPATSADMGMLEFHYQGKEGQAPLALAELTVAGKAKPPEAPAGRGAAAVKPGPVHAAADLAGFRPFKATFQDGKFAKPAEAQVGQGGLFFHCWKAESVAEFRAVEDEGKIALGVTNLNDAPSSQFILDPEQGGSKPLDRAAKYVARLEYRADNDAAGALTFRSAEGEYKVFNALDLPGTGGAWKTLELPLDVPPAGPLQLLVENTTVGEGNLLLFRRLEVVEGK